MKIDDAFIDATLNLICTFVPGQFYFDRKHIKELRIIEITAKPFAEVDGHIRNPLTDSVMTPVLVVEADIESEGICTTETIYCDMTPRGMRLVGKWETEN